MAQCVEAAMMGQLNRRLLMPVLPRSLEIQGEISAIRRDIHAHPELAYEENRTSDVVAAKLTEWGLESRAAWARPGWSARCARAIR